MLKYALILEKETLEPLQKVPYVKNGLHGVIQGGTLGIDLSEIILSFYEPMESVSRVYFIKFTMSSNASTANDPTIDAVT